MWTLLIADCQMQIVFPFFAIFKLKYKKTPCGYISREVVFSL
jgi:hypothetical protein